MFIISDYVLVIELPQFHLFFTTFDFFFDIVLNAAFDLIIHLIFSTSFLKTSASFHKEHHLSFIYNCDATGSAPEYLITTVPTEILI